MKTLTITNLTLLTLLSQSGFAEPAKDYCNGAYKTQPIATSYTTQVQPKERLHRYFESPNGQVQIYSLAGREADGHYDNIANYQIIVRKEGRALLLLKDRGSRLTSDDHTLWLNRVLFSPDGKQALLVMDDPQVRSYFGRSNTFRLVDLETGEKKVMATDVVLGDWRVYQDLEQERRYPFVYSADSEKIFISDKKGLRIMNAKTGEEIGKVDRAAVGYSPSSDRNMNVEESADSLRQKGVKAVAFSADRTHVLISFRTEAPVLYNLDTQQVVAKMPLSEGEEWSHLTLVDAENVVGILRKDGESVVHWNAKSGEMKVLTSNNSRLSRIETLVQKNGVSVALTVGGNKSATSEEIVAMTLDGKLVKMKLKKFTVREPSSKDTFSALSLSPDGLHLLVFPRPYRGEHEAYIFNTRTGKRIMTLPAYGSAEDQIWLGEDSKTVFLLGPSVKGEGAVQKLTIPTP